MADLRCYRDAQPLSVPWPLGGMSVKLRPLPLVELQGAELQGASAPPESRWMRRAAERLSRALEPQDSITADALLELLTPGQLAGLAAAQWVAQQRAMIDPGALSEWVRKSVNDHPEVLEEAAVAWHSESASAFYGRPGRELTQAQLCWFLCLQSAFEEFHVGVVGKDGKRRPKRPSPPWLRKDREERLRWQIAC